MSLQLSVAIRNAALEALAATIGASPKLRFYMGVMPTFGTIPPDSQKLVEFVLGATWTVGSINGSKALANTPFSVAAIKSGTATFFQLTDASGTGVHIQGRVGADGVLLSDNTLPEFEIDNPNITQGQSVTVSSWAINSPGA